METKRNQNFGYLDCLLNEIVLLSETLSFQAEAGIIFQLRMCKNLNTK